MNKTKIQVLIPTLNNIDDIDVTLESIWNQTLSMEDIYVTVMDFGSTDGTYEKLLKYNKYHLGVYRNTVTQNRRLMISYMTKLVNYLNFDAQYALKTTLYPGDVLYPDYMGTCSKALIEAWGYNPAMLVSETDVWDGCQKKSQSPIFNQDCIIDCGKNITVFSSGKYQNQIQCMLPLSTSKTVELKRFCGEMNEQRWWNKLYLNNMERNLVYLNKPLSCQKVVLYESEAEEILLRWESIITSARRFAAKKCEAFDSTFEEKAKQDLSEYALWRGYLLLNQEDNTQKKEAIDCIILAGIIFPQIKAKEVFCMMQSLAMGENSTAKVYLHDYFASREITDIHKKYRSIKRTAL